MRSIVRFVVLTGAAVTAAVLLAACGGGAGSPAAYDGEWIAFHAEVDGNLDVYKVRADGSGLTRLTDAEGNDGFPVWSPDGRRIAFLSERTGNTEIFVMDADGGNLVQITNDEALDYGPVWSPDGTQIAFISDRNRTLSIYITSAEGGEARELTDNMGNDEVISWSPDGTRLAFQSTRSGNYDVYVINADGSEMRKVTSHLNADVQPDWSPDGTLLAFAIDLSGKDEETGEVINIRDIYTIPVDSTEARAETRLTQGLGTATAPVWSPDGSLIAFRAELDGRSAVYVIPAGGGSVTRVNAEDLANKFISWAPDSRRLVFEATTEDAGQAIFVAAADASDLKRLQVAGATVMGAPNWQPKG